MEDNNSGIRKALGLGEDITFQGQVWHLEPLTFLDLADAEALGLLKVGDAETLTTTSVLWLMLRKADPALSDTQRDLCQYTMTPRAARNLFGLQGQDGGEAVAEFMSRIIAAAGLNATEAEAADTDAGETPKDPAAKKGRGAKAEKPAVPATPIAE